MSRPWRSLILMLAGVFLCTADLKKYDSQDSITCSQGLKRCTVSNKMYVVPPPDFGPVEVLSFNAEPALCSKATPPYTACLRIRIQLRILADDDGSGETSEDSEDEDHAALMLCYMSPPNLLPCKTIEFTVKSNTWKNHENSEIMVVVYDGMFLGSTVNVTVSRMSQVVHFPQQNSVCPSPDIEECKTPRIVPEIDEHRGVVELKAELEEMLQMCMKRKGMSSCWPSNRTIPLHAVTHCMCFQAWKQNTKLEISSRAEICPFGDHKGFRRNAVKNVSLSVGHSETNEGLPALSWKMSAPCRLELEVWPCLMAMSLGGGCREVPGYRQNLSVWDENVNAVWTSGVFLGVQTTNSLLLCVMFKVDREMFGPVCEQDTHRGRWICLVLVMLLVLILLTVAVFVLRRRLNEWLSNSSPMHQSRGLCGDVLLVHSSGSDPCLSDTVCWFATWLSELGFSVSLDLWNQAAVSAMGPTPWLHSRLQHVQNHGGKTLLLLSHDAVCRAKAFYETWGSVLNREDVQVSNTSWPWNSDVFCSALSSLFSARLQGGTVERFVLVQLEPESLDMPELFHGLKLYQLPSESQRLLTDLHTGRPGSLGARFKGILWVWRASARLQKKLRNREQHSRTESTLTQVDSLSMGNEMEEETLPLQT